MTDPTPDPTPDPAAAFRRARSEAWLRDFAHQSGLTYEGLLERFDGCTDGSVDSVYFGGDDALTPTEILYQHADEFWRHYETVLNADVPNKDDITFRCAC